MKIDEQRIEQLLSSLSSKSPSERIAAALALGDDKIATLVKCGVVGMNRIPDALIKLLNDANMEVRISAAWSLDKLGVKDNRMVEPLFISLRHPDIYTQFHAGLALARLGEHLGVQRVIEFLSEYPPEPMDFDLEIRPVLRELRPEFREEIITSLGYDPNKC